MRLRDLLEHVDAMGPSDAKAYMEAHKQESYLLLDVREIGEYEQEHLPGAKLIPLSQLSDSLHLLDPEKPTIVYCAVGGRSRVAAQTLTGKGFHEVYNLKGGIQAWKGEKARGSEQLGMDLLKGDFTMEGVFRIAAAMETGLQRFYRLLAETFVDRELVELCSMLAEIETKHLESLKKLASEVGSSIDMPDENETPEALEGGYNVRAFLEKVKPQIETVPDALGVAIMLEAQAMDLYMRFSYESKEDVLRKVLDAIATKKKAI